MIKNWRGNWQMVGVADGTPPPPHQQRDTFPNLPWPEVAFWGRSNVGKSSLINGLTLHHNLARSSKTPGRTRQLFFFQQPALPLTLVDLPGYGFSHASRGQALAWQDIIFDYLADRRQLRLVCLLLDSRQEMKELDRDAIDLLRDHGISTQIILTKADKLPAPLLAARVAAEEKLLLTGHYSHCLPQAVATSSETRLGLDNLRAIIEQSLGV